jgi:hypothetical protein
LYPSEASPSIANNVVRQTMTIMSTMLSGAFTFW